MLLVNGTGHTHTSLFFQSEGGALSLKQKLQHGKVPECFVVLGAATVFVVSNLESCKSTNTHPSHEHKRKHTRRFKGGAQQFSLTGQTEREAMWGGGGRKKTETR